MVRLIELTAETPADELGGDSTLIFLADLARIGLQKAIPNLNGKLGAVIGPNAAVPYIASNAGGGRGYLDSFTRMYMDGAADELASSKSRLLRLASPVAALSGGVARSFGMDD